MTRRGRVSSRLAGVLLGIGLVAFMAIAFSGGLPLPGGGAARTVAADVSSSGDLRKGDDVRVHGVDVGHVQDVDLDPSGRHARISLAITDDHLDVRSDARLALRWRTVLGGAMYVDLDPGTSAAPPLRGRVLPRSRTTAQVELDDIVAVAKGSTPHAVRTILSQGAQALGDAGTVHTLLTSAPPRLDVIGRGVAALRGARQGDLTQLVRAGARVTAALDADRHRLADLIDGAAATLGTVADHRAQLGATLRSSPAALAQTDVMLHRLDRTLDDLDPLTARLPAGLRTATRTLPAARRTLARVSSLAVSARPLLRALPGAMSDLAGAAVPLQTTIEGAKPLVAKTQASLLPWLAARDPRTRLKTFEAIGPTFAVATHAEFDNGGFFLPFPADVDEGGLQDGPELPDGGSVTP